MIKKGLESLKKMALEKLKSAVSAKDSKKPSASKTKSKVKVKPKAKSEVKASREKKVVKKKSAGTTTTKKSEKQVSASSVTKKKTVQPTVKKSEVSKDKTTKSSANVAEALGLKDLRKPIDSLLAKGHTEGVLSAEEILAFMNEAGIKDAEFNKVAGLVERENIEIIFNSSDGIEDSFIEDNEDSDGEYQSGGRNLRSSLQEVDASNIDIDEEESSEDTEKEQTESRREIVDSGSVNDPVRLVLEGNR